MKNKLITILFLTIYLLSFNATSSQEQMRKGYIIGPGDILEIKVWDHDDLSRSVQVSQGGEFTFPFIGKVKVENLSSFEIENLLAKKLSNGFLVAPQVSVEVVEYLNKKVFVFGEVKKPGTYILKHNYTFLELISEAGGFTEDKGQFCFVVRPGEKENKTKPILLKNALEKQIIKLKIDDLITGSTGSFNVIPGDSVYISESEKIYVTGEVKAPGKVKWNDKLTVREAVSLAGGETPKASINRVQIIRIINGIENVLKPKLSDFVQPDDIIKVPESYF